MTNSTVRVVADELGNIINVSKNSPEYGYVRVQQVVAQVNDEGWLRMTKRSALIKGKVEDLMEMNYADNQELPGKIVVKEQVMPFNEENPERDLKIAGDTGIVCRIDDQPIYRQTFYTTNQNSIDELLMHTNGIEIREVQAAQKTLFSLNRRKETAKL